MVQGLPLDAVTVVGDVPSTTAKAMLNGCFVRTGQMVGTALRVVDAAPVMHGFVRECTVVQCVSPLPSPKEDSCFPAQCCLSPLVLASNFTRPLLREPTVLRADAYCSVYMKPPSLPLPRTPAASVGPSHRQPFYLVGSVDHFSKLCMFSGDHVSVVSLSNAASADGPAKRVVQVTRVVTLSSGLISSNLTCTFSKSLAFFARQR